MGVSSALFRASASTKIQGRQKRREQGVIIKTVIWDMDGTIADSAALHYHAWQATMRCHGVDYPYQLFIDSFGRNNAEILAEQLDNPDAATITAISQEKEAAYRCLVTPETLRPNPGVRELLASFRQQGTTQIVGSSGPMANIAAMVRALDIGDYFLALVTGTHLPKGKPDPAIFLRCAAVAGVSPGECLVIEDSIHGIEAAQRAGMRSVAVGTLATSAALQPYRLGNAGGASVGITDLSAIKTAAELFAHFD